MKNKTTEHNPGASETTRLFCTQISSAAGAAGELCTGKRKEPDLAKRNTNPGIGESVDPGVMHNPDASHTRARGKRRFHRMARENLRRQFRSRT